MTELEVINTLTKLSLQFQRLVWWKALNLSWSLPRVLSLSPPYPHVNSMQMCVNPLLSKNSTRQHQLPVPHSNGVYEQIALAQLRTSHTCWNCFVLLYEQKTSCIQLKKNKTKQKQLFHLSPAEWKTEFRTNWPNVQ